MSCMLLYGSTSVCGISNSCFDDADTSISCCTADTSCNDESPDKSDENSCCDNCIFHSPAIHQQSALVVSTTDISSTDEIAYAGHTDIVISIAIWQPPRLS